MDYEKRSAEPGLETTDPDPALRGETSTGTEHLEGEWDLEGSLDADASTLADDEEPETLTFLGPADEPESLGSLDGYPVQSVLGRGAMGIVLKAFDRALHRPVAIKVLSPVLASSPSFRERFLREARAAAAISHPNVVTIHAVGDHRGLPYLVMEYIPGRTLAQRIHSRPRLEPIDLIRIGVQIAAGLDAAHTHGLIHRDVKPSNLMLEDSIERVKITDFGLARAAMDQSGLTSLGRIVGTPAYMSPEQVHGGKLDARSDLFALGCVFWAMASGHSPFRASHMVGIIRNVQELVPPALSEVDPRIPEELSQIVSRLLRKNPADRYATAHQVAAELSRLLSRLQLDSGHPEGSVSATESIPQPTAPRRRLPRRAVLGATALACTVAVVLGLLDPGRLPVRSRRGAPAVVAGPTPAFVPLPVARDARTLTVSRTGTAHFRSIAEALAAARADMEIRVLDDATYAEPLRIDQADRYRNLRLVSLRRARLVAPETGPIVAVKSTAGVRIQGFRIEPGLKQFGVEVTGPCPGLTLDQLVIKAPPEGQWAVIWLHRNVSGDSGRPIRIENSEIQAGPRGITLEGDSLAPATAISIAGNRFFVREGAAIQLLVAVREIRVTSNIFVGQKSLTMILDDPGVSGDILVANNTFSGVKYWLNLTSTSPAIEDVRIARNLILGGTVRPSPRHDLSQYAESWQFEDNRWTRGPGDDDLQMLRIADQQDPVEFVSRNRASAAYLVPGKDSGLDLGPPEADRPSYVGARAPRE